MIANSAPWKDQLLADADMLERWAGKTSATSRRSTLFERKIFLAAYAIRKLVEAGKLSTAFNEGTLAVTRFPSLSGREERETLDLGKLYDFEKPRQESISPRCIIDLVIHSYVFSEELDEYNNISAFVVTSKENRADGLYRITLGDFTKLMRRVGGDYPSAMRKVKDAQTGEWVVWAGHGEPPEPVERKLRTVLQRALAHRKKFAADETNE